MSPIDGIDQSPPIPNLRLEAKLTAEVVYIFNYQDT